MNLTHEDKRTLLKISRSAIRSALGAKPAQEKTVKSEALKQQSGVFVTLRIDEHLRGCIGYVEPIFPLAQAT
jgi:uncharacterized protein